MTSPNPSPVGGVAGEGEGPPLPSTPPAVTHPALGEAARDLKDKAQGQADDLAAGRKDAAAERVGGVARALADMASNLEERGQGTEARFTRQAADGLSQLARATQGKEVGDIVAAVEDFGRRQPALLLTGAVAVGFALSRFLKSSPDRHRAGARADIDAEARRTAPLGQRGGNF